MARLRLRRPRLLSRRTSPRQRSLEKRRDNGCVEASHGTRSPKRARRASCFYWRDATAKGLIFSYEPSALQPCYHTVTLFATFNLKKTIFDTPRHMAVCRSHSIG